MGKILERCHLCKWWDYKKQISVVRLDKNIEGYLGEDQAAKCNYKHAPSDGLPWSYRIERYTFSEYFCSAFVLHENYYDKTAKKEEGDNVRLIELTNDRTKPVCTFCSNRGTVVEMEDDDEDNDSEPIFICKKCLEKAIKLFGDENNSNNERKSND